MPAKRRPRFDGTIMAAGAALLILAALSWRFEQPKGSFYIPWNQGMYVTAPLALGSLGVACVGIGLLYLIFDLLVP